MVDLQTSSSPLSRSQVFNLVQQNGGTPQEAGLLTAIAFGNPGGIPESSGNPTVINDNPRTGDYSVGIWQINFRTGVGGAVNPSRTLGGITYTVSQLQNDLNAQAQAALSILRGTGNSISALSTQWGGFRNNPAGEMAYAQQLTEQLTGNTDTLPAITTTTPAQTQTDTGTGATTTTTASSNPSQPTSMNLSFADSIQHSIVQILLVLVGIALLLGGIYLIGSKA